MGGLGHGGRAQIVGSDLLSAGLSLGYKVGSLDADVAQLVEQRFRKP